MVLFLLPYSLPFDKIPNDCFGNLWVQFFRGPPCFLYTSKTFASVVEILRITSSYLEAAAAMAESPLRALEAGGEALTACFVLSLLRVAGVGDFR